MSQRQSCLWVHHFQATDKFFSHNTFFTFFFFFLSPPSLLFLPLKGRILILGLLLSAVSLLHPSCRFLLLLQKAVKPSLCCCSHHKTIIGSVLPIALNTNHFPCIQGLCNLLILFNSTKCKPYLFLWLVSCTSTANSRCQLVYILRADSWVLPHV